MRRQQLYNRISKRNFATKYSGKVITKSENEKIFSVQVETPDIPRDIKGYTVPRKHLICKITQILDSTASSLDPYLDLTDYLESLTITLTPSEVSEILKSLHTPYKALEFFKFCYTIPNFRHDCFTYNRILSILSKCEGLEIVRKVLDEMEKNGVRGSISTVNILIGIFGCGGKEGVVGLEKCLGLVKKWDLKFNCYTYKCVLQAYLRLNESGKAFEVYREMRRKGYVLDIFAFNMLLDALAKDEKVRFLNYHFSYFIAFDPSFSAGGQNGDRTPSAAGRRMENFLLRSIPAGPGVMNRDLPPAVFFSYHFIREIRSLRTSPGQAKGKEGVGGPETGGEEWDVELVWWKVETKRWWEEGLVEQAYKVFADMKRKHCEPDEYTYTIMIRMIGKTGKADECLALFQEMLTKGCAPNQIAYNTMIQALAKNRMVDKVIFLFSKMIENGCQPNEFTYSVILNVLVVEGQLGKLDEVIDVSKKYINKSIYAYLVKTLSKLGHANEAHRLFCNMWSFHDKGDRDAYMSMLESLCEAGRTAEALDLLSKIHEKGISTNTVMYNMVFSALGKQKAVSHLHDLYEKMKCNGPLPDIFTYNILISSYGRAGNVVEAVKLFEEMENSNCKPDIISYNSLINCLGKNGDLDEAHMRFKEMQEVGLNPDVITYSTLIECFGKTSRVEMACTLFDEMLAEGCFPNIVTYNILLDCLERCGKSTEALELYAKLKQQGLTPDKITYTVLERLQSGSQRKVRIRRQNPITGWVVSPLR
ncbi:hypothetical protein IFM89_020124 [Coptis chinensis]|uniref:PROP1-like PPR domain-containing protein n=1 Tax=Coptis chinensis TaxID=261450 RepID=A0A835IFA7_9MAGN|nr:hypothetical protein IFM89_020124 [Coptis chinensis]